MKSSQSLKITMTRKVDFAQFLVIRVKILGNRWQFDQIGRMDEGWTLGSSNISWLGAKTLPTDSGRHITYIFYISNIYLNCEPTEREKKFIENDNPVLLQNIYFWNLFRHKIVSVYLVMISEQFPFIYYHYWEMSFWKKFSSA